MKDRLIQIVQEADGVMLCCIQFAVDGLLSLVAAFLFEQPDFRLLLRGWVPLLYTGVLSCGVAYTLQIIGQQYTNPFLASLILSLESVISVLAGWLFLGEMLTLKELAGCILVFAAIIIAQLPAKRS